MSIATLKNCPRATFEGQIRETPCLIRPSPPATAACRFPALSKAQAPKTDRLENALPDQLRDLRDDSIAERGKSV